MADNIFNPDADGSVNDVKTFVTGGSKDNNLVENVKIGNYDQKSDNDSETSPDMGTITLGATSSVDDVSGLGVFSCVSGHLAFDLGSHSLTIGDIFFVNDGSGILSGGYQVLTVSGNTVCTTAYYPSCGDASGTNLTWALPSGTVDPLLDYFIVQSCDNPSVSNNNYSHKFISYVSHVYTDCWDCFTGVYDPCDVTVTEVTLWDDQYADYPRMYAVDSAKVIEGNSSGKSASVGVNNPSGQNKS